jgi:hypothetical protein
MKMKLGKSLTELAKEIERQFTSKKDYVAPTQQIEFDALVGFDGQQSPALELGDTGKCYGMTDLAEGQLANRLGIPKKYYDKCKVELPELLNKNVNGWLQKQNDKLLVRTLDHKTRAILSDKYRPLDNFDLAKTVLPIIADGMQVVSCDLTDTNLYIKAVSPKISAEVSKGDVVQMGIVISNSEVGCGAVSVLPMIYRLICTNGMISADNSLRKYHIGKQNTGEENLREYFSTETRRLDDKVFWNKVKDIVTGAMSELMFNNLVDKMRLSKSRIIEAQPLDVIEVVSDKYALTDTEGASILAHLIAGKELSQYGLLNAVTRSAEDVPSYDRATELEKIGGSILELSGKDWSRIACA